MADPESLHDYLKRTRAPRKSVPGPLGVGVPELALQADAFMRGAANVVTLGLADKAAAAVDAAFQPAGAGDWRQRYDANLAQQEARDRYDAQHRRAAQTAGQVAGTGLGLAFAPSKIGGLGTRIAGAAPMTVREVGSLLGGGAAVGAGTQGVGDAMTGQYSTVGDYAGAAAGGLAGAATLLPLGAGRAAAVDGAVTSAAQDFLNGRAVSTQNAGRNAITGRALGRLGEKAALDHIASMSIKAKGKLGEALGEIRAVSDWRPRDAVVNKGRDYLLQKGKGPYWMPDGSRKISEDVTKFFEDKFGPSAKLSRNQLMAQAVRGENFQLNHFLPQDVAMAVSRLTGATGSQASSRVQQQPRERPTAPSRASR